MWISFIFLNGFIGFVRSKVRIITEKNNERKVIHIFTVFSKW